MPGVPVVAERVVRIAEACPPRPARRIQPIPDVAGCAIARVLRQDRVGRVARLARVSRPPRDVHQRDARVGVGRRLDEHPLAARGAPRRSVPPTTGSVRRAVAHRRREASRQTGFERRERLRPPSGRRGFARRGNGVDDLGRGPRRVEPASGQNRKR